MVEQHLPVVEELMVEVVEVEVVTKYDKKIIYIYLQRSTYC